MKYLVVLMKIYTFASDNNNKSKLITTKINCLLRKTLLHKY